jgi:hypothetical protein
MDTQRSFLDRHDRGQFETGELSSLVPLAQLDGA